MRAEKIINWQEWAIFNYLAKKQHVTIEEAIRTHLINQAAYTPSHKPKSGIYKALKDLPAFEITKGRYYFLKKCRKVLFKTKTLDFRAGKHTLVFKSQKAFERCFQPLWFSNKCESRQVNFFETLLLSEELDEQLESLQ